MLNDPSNQMIGSSSNPANNPGSSSNPNTQTPYFPTFSQQNPYMNPDDFALFSQWKMQQQQQYSTFSQQQQQNQNESQPRSSQQSFHLVDETEDDEEEEPVPTPTSKKTKVKKVAKTKTKKTQKTQPTTEDEDEAPKRARSLWTDGEELLLAETYIQVSEDPKEGADQQRDTFWYKVMDVYNKEAKRLKYPNRSKNMITGKWTPMNRDVGKFNTIVCETALMSGENDKDFMERCHMLFKRTWKNDFKHSAAWNFLKDKHKWKNPDSTNARRNRLRVTEEDPEHFGPDALPRPDGMYRIQKSQRSSNSTASSGSNPGMFQEMLQQQYELERKMKQDVLERESRARVDLLESQKIAEDMRVLTMDTSSLDPMNAAIVIDTACKTLAPHKVCEYLCNLSKLFNRYYREVPPGEIILGLCKATEVVMNKCFYLLGIAPDPSLAHFNHRAFLSYVDRPVKEVRATNSHIIPTSEGDASMPRDDPIIERIPRRSLKKRNITPSKNELPHIGSNVAFEENMISRSTWHAEGQEMGRISYHAEVRFTYLKESVQGSSNKHIALRGMIFPQVVDEQDGKDIWSIYKRDPYDDRALVPCIKESLVIPNYLSKIDIECQQLL
ncbi:glutathione S-transferase T3-like protein [Tanacetum coccineum]